MRVSKLNRGSVYVSSTMATRAHLASDCPHLQDRVIEVPVSRLKAEKKICKRCAGEPINRAKNVNRMADRLKNASPEDLGL